MREVVADPEQAAAVGMRAREDIARVLSPRTTGAAMRKRLEQLARGDAQQGQESDQRPPDLLAQESPGQGQASE
jgi:hypothetical protein